MPALMWLKSLPDLMYPCSKEQGKEKAIAERNNIAQAKQETYKSYLLFQITIRLLFMNEYPQKVTITGKKRGNRGMYLITLVTNHNK